MGTSYEGPSWANELAGRVAQPLPKLMPKGPETTKAPLARGLSYQTELIEFVGAAVGTGEGNSLGGCLPYGPSGFHGFSVTTSACTKSSTFRVTTTKP